MYPSSSKYWREYTKKSNVYIVLSLILASYFLAYFHRTMSGILKPEITFIAIKNRWDPVKLLGIFSGTYFYTYALAQLIVGPIVDSLGVRRAGFIFLLVMTFGTLMMSVDDAWVLVIGRLLVGFAASVAYLSFHRASSYYYPKESQGLLTAVAIVVGNAGSLASTYPLRLMLLKVGMKSTMIFFAAITLLIAIMLFRTDTRDSRGAFKTNFKTTMNGIKHVLRDTHIYGIGVSGIITYAMVVSFQSSWGQMFYETLGLSADETSKRLLLIPLVLMPTSIIVGYISDDILRIRKPFLLVAGCLSISSWILLLLAYMKSSSILALVGTISLGLTVGFHIVQPAAAKELYPPEISASTIALMNVMTFSGISVFNTISPVIGIRSTLLLMLGVSLIGFPFIKLWVKETLRTS